MNKNTIEQPYEKFVKYGAGSLSESELLAIILRTGTKDLSALEIAGNVLSLGKYPREGLLGLYDVSLDELCKIKGVGMVKAIKLKALTEVSMRMHRACAKSGFKADNPSSVADYFMEDLRHLDHETVMLCGLDAKLQLLFSTKVSEGSVNMSLISPRTVFLKALKGKAVYIILVHNHPSGDPTPSCADFELTESIDDAGRMLEIKLLDHIIIGDNKYYSFKEEGRLKRRKE
ncbi:MAG: DNA repair protein RadC [Lachnospiraceae bacterium]|nr:DNA repair protein RadC [Lachnospiraceae bacterium]